MEIPLKIGEKNHHIRKEKGDGESNTETYIAIYKIGSQREFAV